MKQHPKVVYFVGTKESIKSGKGYDLLTPSREVAEAFAADLKGRIIKEKKL